MIFGLFFAFRNFTALWQIIEENREITTFEYLKHKKINSFSYREGPPA